jgi:hypothetical protein
MLRALLQCVLLVPAVCHSAAAAWYSFVTLLPPLFAEKSSLCCTAPASCCSVVLLCITMPMSNLCDTTGDVSSPVPYKYVLGTYTLDHACADSTCKRSTVLMIHILQK